MARTVEDARAPFHCFPPRVPVVAQVLREVKAVYRMVSEAVINLADKFFEMDRTDAQLGLELYKVGRQEQGWHGPGYEGGGHIRGLSSERKLSSTDDVPSRVL